MLHACFILKSDHTIFNQIAALDLLITLDGDSRAAPIINFYLTFNIIQNHLKSFSDEMLRCHISKP